LASPMSPVVTNVMSRKEKAKEEKERKAAKKEEEKADKQKLKDYNIRMREIQKKQDADLKAALEASKVTKNEEDHKVVSEAPSKENLSQNNPPPAPSPVLGGLDRFVRSKSIRFSSLGKKERPTSVFVDDTNAGPSTEQLIPEEKKPEEKKEKKNRFSIRKKSFGMLSDK